MQRGWLAEPLSVGGVTCVFTDDVDSALDDLQRWAIGQDGAVRLIGQTCDPLPRHSDLLESLVRSLAESALLLWPDWYEGSHFTTMTDDAGDHSLTDAVIARQIGDGVNASWLTTASANCRSGKAPIVSQLSLAVQVRQLVLAMTTQQLVVAICLQEQNPIPDRLLGFARALEWLAREANASVLALLPVSLETRAELDGISSGARYQQPQPFSIDSNSLETVSNVSVEEKHRVCPILGRPHPASPGEQLLAQRLSDDAELAGMFGFNERVQTVFDSRLLVDLLWSEGRVIVEVDGYGYHSSRSAFNADRHRDYELILSGYVVLRLPHDFVVQDVQLAVERIRELVHFRIQHPYK